MDFLKKNNWWLCLIINILTCGIFYIVLAKFMKLYDKDAWYMNKWYWILGGFFIVVPAAITMIDSGEKIFLIILAAPFTMITMLMVFALQMMAKVAANLEVSGSKIYNTPYTWIILIIIPLVGWILFAVMYLYILILPNIQLARGYGEKYIKQN